LLETQGFVMEGLVIDFPRSPSLDIDWESEEENKEPENESLPITREVSPTREKLAYGGRSKSMRDCRREKSTEEESESSKVPADEVDLASSPPSPVISSRKRRRQMKLTQPRLPLPRVSATIPVASSGDQKELKRTAEEPGGGGAKDRRCSTRGEAKVLVGSSWIANVSRLEEAESGDCSQDIIASWATGEVRRTEEEETREQLRGAEVGRLLGSSWIADLSHMGKEVDSGSQCSASIGSWEGEAKVQPFGEKSEIVENVYEEEGTEREVEGIGRSRRRKKALKGGLEEQLERALEWGRSGQALRRHQGDVRGSQVTVQRLNQVGDCLVVHCVCQGDSSAPNGKDVRGESLVLLINRLFCPILPVPGQKVFYSPPFTSTKDRAGFQLVVGLTGLYLGEIAPPSVLPEEVTRSESMDLRCPCMRGGSCPGSVAPVRASPVATVTLHTNSSQPPSQLTPLSAAVEQAVKSGIGGSNSSRMVIEVEVRLIWGSATALHAQQVELLVEEQGHSVVLRPIGSGGGWEGVLSGDVDLVIGAKVKVWGMFDVQGRHTRSNHRKLFKVLEGTSAHQQRILYALNVSGGGIEVLEAGKVPEISCPSLREAFELTPDSRVNIGCKILHLERAGDTGLLHIQEMSGGSPLRVPCDLSSMLVAQVANQANPFSCILASAVVLGSSSLLSTDSYSCLFDCKPILLSDLVSNLPPSSTVGDLVCVAGALEEVDMVASTQWLECQDCQCEEVVEGRCKSCGGSEVEKRIQLIARIGNDWVELSQERATSLLPAIQETPAFDKDHLGTVEPKTILSVNIPPFLATVVEGGSLKELKPLGEV